MCRIEIRSQFRTDVVFFWYPDSDRCRFRTDVAVGQESCYPHLQSWTWIYTRRLWKMAKNLQHSYLPKSSVFQGALLYSTTNFVEHSDIKRTTTPNIFKNKVKKVILDCQEEGETIEWEVDNFALYKCKGLRAGSNKRNKKTLRYTQFFLIKLITAPQLKN